MMALKIINFNIRGLANKLNDLKVLLAEQNPDIVCLNETFLNNTKIYFPCYDSIFNNRPTHSGGSLVLIKNNIPHHSIKKLIFKNNNIISLKINLPNLKFKLISLYIDKSSHLNLDLIKTATKKQQLLI